MYKRQLQYLTDTKIPWAIATSGRMLTAGPVLKILGVDPDLSLIHISEPTRPY